MKIGKERFIRRWRRGCVVTVRISSREEFDSGFAPLTPICAKRRVLLMGNMTGRQEKGKEGVGPCRWSARSQHSLFSKKKWKRESWKLYPCTKLGCEIDKIYSSENIFFLSNFSHFFWNRRKGQRFQTFRDNEMVVNSKKLNTTWMIKC